MKSQTFIFPGFPSCLSGGFMKRRSDKIEERPSISPRHAPLLSSLATIYIAHNNM